MVANSFLEMLGVGAISPLLSVAVGNVSSRPVQIISDLTGFTSTSLLHLVAIGFIFLTIGKNCFSLFTFAQTTRFYTRIYRSMSTRLLQSFLSQEYTWFVNRNSSDFPRLIIQEVIFVARGIIYNLLLTFTNSVLALGLVILLALESWKAALIMLFVLGGLYFLMYLFFRQRLRFLGKKRFRLDKSRFTLLNNIFGGIKEVKIREKEEYYLERYKKVALEVARNTFRSDVYGVIPRYFVETFLFVIFGIMIILLNSTGINIQELLPSISLYAFAGYRLMPTLQKISRSVNAITTKMESLEKLKYSLQTYSYEEKKDHGIIHLKDKINIEQVSFAYPESIDVVLNRFSLEIKSCEKIGLVGFSGSGKTTLLNLLMGLLEPDSGYISIDGCKLTKENISGWRKNLGLVSQDVYLLDGTIAENIAFGIKPSEIDQERLEAAARSAEIHNTIMNMPEGYKTQAGERGVKLSGGQAQRIVIARALYHQPDVLIFDEATSAMDNLTEKAIMDSINRLSGEKTLIIVAHRLSTVKDCDRIILMKDGKILNQGNYDFLIENEPEFKRLAMETDA
ncbi:MAG: ABC transporter ATP-binding protein [Spirochaetales bacterium]|nr:ABC transporter ATP-binding protein [Spirochaetales bacterium]